MDSKDFIAIGVGILLAFLGVGLIPALIVTILLALYFAFVPTSQEPS